MADALILAFASLGLVGIVLGIKEWRFLSRSAGRAPGVVAWSRLRVASLIVGLTLAIASLVLPTGFAYPVSTPEGPGRIVGWPFFVAFIDSAGRDYVGFITYLGALGNFVFWILVPQVFLAAYARRKLSRHAV